MVKRIVITELPVPRYLSLKEADTIVPQMLLGYYADERPYKETFKDVMNA